MPDFSLSKFSEYGLIGLILAALFFMLWKMLTWVMSFIREIQKQQAEERVIWLAKLEKIGDVIAKVNDGIDDHDRRADGRGKFVRSEHEKMIENLDEHYKILLRINGEKK